MRHPNEAGQRRPLRKSPALAVCSAALAASRRVAFWPALIATYHLLRYQPSIGVPLTWEVIIGVATLIILWPLAVVAGLWGGLVGWIVAERGIEPERSPAEGDWGFRRRLRAAGRSGSIAAGVWGLWLSLGLVGVVPWLSVTAWGQPVAFVAGPVVVSWLGPRLRDRLIAHWEAHGARGSWFTHGMRWGPEGRWDLRGVAIGAAAGLLVVALTSFGAFDELEAVTLGARIRLRNEPWQLAGGTVELSRWQPVGAFAAETVILDLDDRTASEVLLRSSEFALNARLLTMLDSYHVKQAIVPLVGQPDLEAKPGQVSSALEFLIRSTTGLDVRLPSPSSRYPPLDSATLARLQQDLPALAAALQRQNVVLGLMEGPTLAGSAEAIRWNRLYTELAAAARQKSTANLSGYLIRELPSLRLESPPAPLPVPLLLVGADSTASGLRLQRREARFGAREIPLVAPRRMLINVYGSGPGAVFQHVSYASALAGDRIFDPRAGGWVEPAAFFRGRRVFLDALYQPHYQTPVGGFKASELLAMAADNIATRQYLRPPGLAVVLGLLIFVSALAGHLALSHRPAAGALRLSSGCMVLGIAACLLFVSHGIWLPIVSSLVAALVAYVTVMQVIYVADQRDLEEQRRERLALEQSLAISRSIQASLLPDRALQIGDFHIRCYFEPAQTVGGDFYNFFPLEQDQVALVLGDVSGHGVQGAMYMTVATTLVESRADGKRRPSEVMSDVNTRLYPKIHRLRMFVSLFYGVLELATGRLQWATAGQLPPILLDPAGEARFLSSQGSPLGGMSTSQYRDVECIVEPGETLLILSDGLVEVRGSDGKSLGYPGFLSLVHEVAKHGREQLAENIIRAVKDYNDTGAELDDLTLLVIDRLPIAAGVERPSEAPAGVSV
jgi:serine phosphatase RsbU (regulator of sigma subunit)